MHININYIFTRRAHHMQKTSCYRVTALSPVCLYYAIGGYISVQSRAVFEKQFWRINATKCMDKSISRKNEARRSGGSTQIWEKCGKRDRLSNRNPDTPQTRNSIR